MTYKDNPIAFWPNKSWRVYNWVAWIALLPVWVIAACVFVPFVAILLPIVCFLMLAEGKSFGEIRDEFGQKEIKW